MNKDQKLFSLDIAEHHAFALLSALKLSKDFLRDTKADGSNIYVGIFSEVYSQLASQGLFDLQEDRRQAQ